MSDIIIMTFYV